MPVPDFEMKRRIFYSFIILLTAALLFGCASADNHIPDEPSLAERLVGRYCGYVSGNTDEPDIYLDIYFINGYLIAEAKETYAAYWAMEMIPMDESDLYSTAANTMQINAHFFSGFSNFGEYWPESETYTLCITESGVDFISDDGSTISYVRDDTLEIQHDPEQYREPLIGENNVEYPEHLIGEWYGETADGTGIYLKMDNGGTVRCLSKRADEPVCVHIGLAVFDAESAVFTSMTERVGWSTMPWYDTVGFVLEDGTLILDTPEDCGILPAGQIIFLYRSAEQE